MKGMMVLAAVAALSVSGCCAYRGISQVSLVHVREVSLAENAAASTNGVVEVCTNGVRVGTGRVVVVAENVYVSVGGGSAASNDVSGELSVPLAK
ncbi:MAG TPA: hypothetical protein PKM57_16800 [Kiritimatiellia bacterium]|nr:hypothetical protein [Kiritimatiellia bacterium]HPS08499.1 hypothetical protein [Kiritimatiellia bacterium]